MRLATALDAGTGPVGGPYTTCPLRAAVTARSFIFVPAGIERGDEDEDTYDGTLVSTPIQLFFAWRIWTITRVRWVPVVVGVLAVVAFAGGLWTAIKVGIIKQFMHKPELHAPALVWFLASGAADVIITVVLVFTLVRRFADLYLGQTLVFGGVLCVWGEGSGRASLCGVEGWRVDCVLSLRAVACSRFGSSRCAASYPSMRRFVSHPAFPHTPLQRCGRFVLVSLRDTDLSRWQTNRKTGFAATDSVIDKIIRTTIQTGLVTSIFAILDVIFFMVFPHLAINFIWDLPLSKLYSNALLSTLNAREELSSISTRSRDRHSHSRRSSRSHAGERHTSRAGLGLGEARVPGWGPDTHTATALVFEDMGALSLGVGGRDEVRDGDGV
ncbi:hypothetical protein MSAN_02355000 [Mycena sanguinolenta]|uniref:DUF6534 domain-containing protein n=1 Tax=Mycena sanguinolenta TaxID=230812 RepID=A0A8H7CGL8_9AGAR|nr:hypothetical protein MSAN_02355000 [Mycena sanguinolenta]